MKILLTFLILFSAIGSYAQSNTLTTDDYPITNAMLKANDHEIVIGELSSIDKMWFRNDSLGETVVVEVGTDYFRTLLFHFRNNDIPASLLNRLELHRSVRNELIPVPLSTKQKHIQEFLQRAKPAKASFFTTKKGFTLGTERKKAIDIYGKPDSVRIGNGIEICKWEFNGDTGTATITNQKGKPVAKNSFGYHVTMFFREGKLIAMMLENDMP